MILLSLKVATAMIMGRVICIRVLLAIIYSFSDKMSLITSHYTGFYPDGSPEYEYTLSSGNGNWTGLVGALQFLSESTDEDFASGVANRIDLSKFLKDSVVQSFMLAGDFMIQNGNNFNLYHSDNPSYPLQFSNFANDFDEEFSFNAPGEPSDDPYVLKWILKDPSTAIPFMSRVFSINSYYQKWLFYYSSFLTIMDAKTTPQLPWTRYDALRQFLLPWVEQDLLWQIDTNNDADDFNYSAMNNTYNLGWRYNNVAPQITCMQDQPTADLALSVCNDVPVDNSNSSPSASSKHNGPSAGSIVGIVIGCLAAIAIALYVFKVRKGALDGSMAAKGDNAVTSAGKSTQPSLQPSMQPSTQPSTTEMKNADHNI